MPPDATPWLDAVALSALVTVGVNIVKPFVELVPWPRPAVHDAALRLVSFSLNLGGVLLLAANAGALSLHALPQYVILGALQTVGSHILYNTGPAPASPPAPVTAPQAAQ